MKFKTLLIFVGILTLVKGGFTQTGSIIHVPVASQQANKKFSVEARVDGTGERVVFMRLYFRSDGRESFEYTEMSAGMSGYIGELAPSRFAPPNLEYFILALLTDQKVVTYPKFNPYGNPMIVPVTGSADPVQQSEEPITPLPNPPRAEFVPELAQKDTRPIDQFDELSPILVLSPEIGESFNAGEEVVIAVSFLADQDPIDLSSVILSIDGLNVTRDIEITENLLTYSITNLPSGEHQAMVQGYFASGIPLPAAVWSFEVLGTSKKRRVASSSFRGRVFAETRQENFSGVGFSDNNVGGYLSGQHGFAKYDARVFVTTRENGQFQPRNRFSFGLEVGVLGVKVGDTYPRFNDLILWGKRVRGIHGKLHLGIINFDFITGQTLRATSVTIQPLLDPLTGLQVTDPLGIAIQDTIPTATFKQNLIGGRVSFGSGRNFQLGINALRVRDDVDSVKPGDFTSLPQDNLVAGADLLIGFDNRRFEIRGSVAASLFSTDIVGGPLTKQEIEDQFDVDLPFDPADFSKYFIINASTTPLDPRDLTSLAYNFSLRFNYFKNNFQFGYKTLGSEYASLGNTILRNNLQGFYFQDRMRLYKNKIYLNFGFENYDDNFKPKDNNPVTKLQTLSYGLSLFPGGGFPNLTVSMREHYRDNNVDTVAVDLSQVTAPIIIDTRENNKTNDLTLQLNYDVNLLNVNHAVSLSFITSDRNDRFNLDPFRIQAGIPSTEISSNVQVVSVRTTYQIPLTTTFNFARNDNDFSAGLNTFNFKMFGARADYHFMNRKLQTYFGTNYTTATGVAALDTVTVTSKTDYKRLQFNLGARYEITPGHSIFMDTSLINFSDKGGTFDTTTGAFTPNPSFTDRIFRLYYEKRF